MRMRIFRDAAGRVINIGDWDYQWRREETGLVNGDGVSIMKQVADNPLPEDAVEDVAEIRIDPDGSRHVIE